MGVDGRLVPLLSYRGGPIIWRTLWLRRLPNGSPQKESPPGQGDINMPRGRKKGSGGAIALRPPATAEHEEDPTQPISWSPKHELTASLLALGTLSHRDIADIVGYTPARVGHIARDPRALAIARRAADKALAQTEDLQERIKAAAVDAFEVVHEQVIGEDHDPRLRQKGAIALMDRAGYTPIQRSTDTHTSLDDLVAMRMEAAQKKMASLRKEPIEYAVVVDENDAGTASSDPNGTESCE